MALLEVKDLSVSYGAVKAIEDISIRVDEGEIVALIGPNGAGKSTTLKAISGLLDLQNGIIDNGETLFNGKLINGYMAIADPISPKPPSGEYQTLSPIIG